MSDGLKMAADALTDTLRWLRLKAEIYLHSDFHGCWAVDTSGSKTIPFHFVHSGKSWLHIEGEEPRLLAEGDLVVFPHDDQHVLSSESEYPDAELVNAEQDPIALLQMHNVTGLTCGYFEFQNKANWPLLQSLPPVIVLELSDPTRLKNTRALLQLLVMELEQNEPGTQLAVDYLAHTLFIHILRYQLEHGLQAGGLKALFSPRISQALDLIHTQPEASWTLASLAQGIGMSRAVFAAEFKKLTAKTPMAYLSEWRMMVATDLLKTTDLPLTLIAERCGYQSEAAFRKAFKTITGDAPGAVRKQARLLN